MNHIRQKKGIVRYAFGTALAAALLAGGAGMSQTAFADRGVASQERSSIKAIAKAEKAAAKAPRNAAMRVSLGHAYLASGRFESAVQAFRDALSLGDATASTALSLSLAQVASGDQGGGVATLDQWRESIPASDFGLALALAGETGRGVAVLADALRSGEDSPKLRQNLAYGYALDGRWQEARVMAAQDVPADQLDQRISEWALQGRPEDFRKRVAALLAVPLRSDQGQPEYLALNGGAAAAPQFAAAAAPAAPAADAELPPAGEPDDWSEAQPAFAAAPAPEPLPFESAFAEPAASAPAVPSGGTSFVTRPVIQELPARSLEPGRKANTSRAQAPSQRASLAVPVGAGDTHRVQLGSFLSEERARKAWSIFVSRNPELREFRMLITAAVVNGRNFWRVAATGLDARGASSLCSNVRGRGAGCIAYSVNRPLPGAVPAHGSAAVRTARR